MPRFIETLRALTRDRTPEVRNLERKLRDAEARARRAEADRASFGAQADKLRRTCAALQETVRAVESNRAAEVGQLEAQCRRQMERGRILQTELDAVFARLDAFNDEETQGITNPVMPAATTALPIESLPADAIEGSIIDAPTQYDLMLQHFVRPVTTRSERGPRPSSNDIAAGLAAPLPRLPAV